MLNMSFGKSKDDLKHIIALISLTLFGNVSIEENYFCDY